MSIWWSLHLRREAASVPLARRFLLGTMETAGVDPDISFDLSVALSEACANAVEHGGDRKALGESGIPGTDTLPRTPGSTGSRLIWTARNAVSRSATRGRASPPAARFAQPRMQYSNHSNHSSHNTHSTHSSRRARSRHSPRGTPKPRAAGAWTSSSSSRTTSSSATGRATARWCASTRS